MSGPTLGSLGRYLQLDMNGASFPAKIALLLAVTAALDWFPAQPKDLYVDLINPSSDLEVASLSYALNQANTNTSRNTNASFVLRHLDSSQNQNLLQYAELELLQQNVVALIDGCYSSVPTCELSVMTGIPLIRLYNNNHRRSNCDHVGVSMSARYLSYVRATVQILKTFQWSNVAVLYEVNFVNEVFEFRIFANKKKIRVRVVQLFEQGNETADMVVRRSIHELTKLRVKVILLYAGGMYQEKLLSEKRFCDCSGNYVWILQTDFPVKLAANPDDKVVGFRLPRKRNEMSEQYENALQSSHKIDLFSLRENAVLAHDAGKLVTQVFADFSLKKREIKLLKKVQIQGITGTIQFDKNGLRTSVELDVMNLQNNSFIKIGSWNSTKLKLTQDLARNHQTQSEASELEGRRLRVVTAEAHPFVFFKRDSRGQISYEGYCIDLLHKLASRLKFTYDIQPSTDGAFGSEINGHWTGLIGDLVRKKADLAVAPLTVTGQREQVVDFTVSYTFVSPSMVMKKENKTTSHFLQFMKPFDVPVWLVIFVCFLVVSCALFILNYFSPFGYKNKSGGGTSSEFSFFNSFWFSLGCMLQQGADNTPKAVSGRILTGCYWFCILIWISTYTANLAAFYTVQYLHQPIKTLDDALNSGYAIGVTMSSSYYTFFQSSKSDYYHRIWQRMESENAFPENLEEAIKWVRQKKYIHISDGPLLQYEAIQKPCDLVTFEAFSMQGGLSFAVQSNNSFVKDLSLTILRLQREGSLGRLKRKWWKHKNLCPSENIDALSGQQVSLESMVGVYKTLSGGLLLSFIVLGVEIYWHKRGKEKRLKDLQNLRTSRISQDNPGTEEYDLPVQDS